ncbi:hypothetical protein ACJMK2_013287 [Sinanodonta woodiana]|uniref:UPAR/Ly6 domain-containing protein n=1 Tax=Sinanodonta woodiana TaxID=1069815 RepID=A0ABD3UZN5_SINWO
MDYTRLRRCIQIVGLVQIFGVSWSLKCYTCDNEHSNFLCNSEINLVECEDGMDTCQTIVGYSDISGKLFIMKECTKNESCQLQAAESREAPCNLELSNWICTQCCYTDSCNVNGATILTYTNVKKSLFLPVFLLLIII